MAAYQTGRGRRWSNDVWFALFIAPTVLILLAVIFVPLGWATVLSFTDHNLITAATGEVRWVGLDNYGDLLAVSSPFWPALGLTLVYTFSIQLISLVAGFITAGLVNRGIRFQGFFRMLVLLPWIMPAVVTILLWMWILNPQYGILNFILLNLGLIQTPIAWFASAETAMPMLIVVAVWRGLPYNTLMLLAGLQTVPHDQHEAAMIDGATPLQRFLYITLPAMRKILAVIILNGVIWGFHSFTLIWPATEGGPGRSTEILSVFIYKQAFQSYDMGYASAAGLLGLICLSVIAVVLTRTLRSDD
jgi:multiple sugar transport system permease protein